MVTSLATEILNYLLPLHLKVRSLGALCKGRLMPHVLTCSDLNGWGKFKVICIMPVVLYRFRMRIGKSTRFSLTPPFSSNRTPALLSPLLGITSTMSKLAQMRQGG